MTTSRKARVPPTIDLTADFQQLLSQRRQEYPPSSSSASGSRQPTQRSTENVVRAHKQWLNQAYIIRKHIVSLLGFLYSIRRKYLALGNKSRAHHIREGQQGADAPRIRTVLRTLHRKVEGIHWLVERYAAGRDSTLGQSGHQTMSREYQGAGGSRGSA